MPVVGLNAVIDLYHGDDVSDWSKAKASGILAVIHKATEGTTVKDKFYPARKVAAKASGLLWGSFHYSSGEDPVRQADHYLDYAQPDADEVVCLDLEHSSQPANGPHVPDMTYAQALAFVTRVQQRLKRLPMVYGSDLLKTIMSGHAGSLLNQCPLWLAEYPKPQYTEPQQGLPDGWKQWTLWQYAADGNGPQPHDVPGIGRCDRDTFSGSLDEFNQQWPFTRTATPTPAV